MASLEAENASLLAIASTTAVVNSRKEQLYQSPTDESRRLKRELKSGR
jgi:hypothetical protein